MLKCFLILEPSYIVKPDYVRLRKTYRIPELKKVWQVNCEKLFLNDTEEMTNALKVCTPFY